MEVSKIQAAVTAVFEGDTQSLHGRVSYLRTLIEGVQEALGNGRGQEKAAQLAALKVTHEHFYEIVLKTAEGFVPKGTKGRNTELHRLATFARTSASALRMHVRADGDIATLKAATATKANLKRRDGPNRRPSLRRLKSNADRLGAQLLETMGRIAKADKDTAIYELQGLMERVTKQLAALGVRKPQVGNGEPRMVPRAPRTVDNAAAPVH